MTFTIDQLTALVVAVTALIAAVGVTYAQVRQTHKLVNSRMDELMTTTRALAHAQGKAEATVPPPLVTP